MSSPRRHVITSPETKTRSPRSTSSFHSGATPRHLGERHHGLDAAPSPDCSAAKQSLPVLREVHDTARDADGLAGRLVDAEAAEAGAHLRDRGRDRHAHGVGPEAEVVGCRIRRSRLASRTAFCSAISSAVGSAVVEIRLGFGYFSLSVRGNVRAPADSAAGLRGSRSCPCRSGAAQRRPSAGRGAAQRRPLAGQGAAQRRPLCWSRSRAAASRYLTIGASFRDALRRRPAENARPPALLNPQNKTASGAPQPAGARHHLRLPRRSIADDLRAAVERAGYEVREAPAAKSAAEDSLPEDARERDLRRLRLKFGVSLAVGALLMLAMFMPLPFEHSRLFLPMFLLATPVQFWAGARLLPRGLGGREARQHQHEHAGRGRHQRRLRLQRLRHALAAASPSAGASRPPLLRVGGDHHRA